MSKITSNLKSKITYYTQQQDKFVGRYLESTRRQDRDQVMKVRERVMVYNEVLELLIKEGI